MGYTRFAQMGVPWMEFYLAFAAIVEGFEQYIAGRQLKRHYDTDIPKELRALEKQTDIKLVDDEKFHKSQMYNRDKRRFNIIHSVFSFVINCCMVYFWITPKVWTWVGTYTGTDEYYQSLGFLLATTLINEAMELPWSLYYDFVIEERHGFNKKTYILFFGDMIKTLALTCVFGGPVTCVIVYIVRRFAQTFYIWLWGFTMTLSLVMSILYPNVIAPLFNKFEPLGDLELKKKIEDLAASLSFPLTKLYVMDGSKRSSHSNAYFYGFWKAKRIVLFDTLLNLNHEKIVAVLGHELGHWKHSHTLKHLVWGSIEIFFTFYLYGKVSVDAHTSKVLFESFGYFDTNSVVIGFMLFGNIYSPVSHVLGLLRTQLTRRFEFQADAFAHGLGHGEPLKEALASLHESNLGDYNPDPWYSWYHHSHPPLVERLQAIDMLGKKSK
eukprot:GDKI01037177.1.p1 GENE.GDKI01037177.1~~GDKI01037177.1.p1  ORF type:complete len:438 (-),score=100.56 GDKI01037177.1:230-1543(-)